MGNKGVRARRHYTAAAREESERAKRQRNLSKFLAVTALAAGVGGYANYQRHNAQANAIRAEISHLNAGIQREATMSALRSLKNNGTIGGMSLNELQTSEVVKQVARRDFHDPRAKQLAVKVGLDLLKNADNFTFLRTVLNTQQQIRQLNIELENTDRPARNASVGAACGATAILVPTVLYLSLKFVARKASEFAAGWKSPETEPEEPSREKAVRTERPSSEPNVQHESVAPQKRPSASPTDVKIDKICALFSSSGLDEGISLRAASAIVAFLSSKNAKSIPVTRDGLIGTLVSNKELKEAVQKAGVSIDLAAALKQEQSKQEQPKQEAPVQEQSNGYSDVNLPPELYLTPGPWQELATLNPSGKKASEFRQIIEGHGFTTKGSAGHLDLYYNDEPVRSPDGRQVCIVGHGRSMGKSHVRAVGKRLALFLWNRRDSA